MRRCWLLISLAGLLSALVGIVSATFPDTEPGALGRRHGSNKQECLAVRVQSSGLVHRGTTLQTSAECPEDSSGRPRVIVDIHCSSSSRALRQRGPHLHVLPGKGVISSATCEFKNVAWWRPVAVTITATIQCQRQCSGDECWQHTGTEGRKTLNGTDTVFAAGAFCGDRPDGVVSRFTCSSDKPSLEQELTFSGKSAEQITSPRCLMKGNDEPGSVSAATTHIAAQCMPRRCILGPKQTIWNGKAAAQIRKQQRQSVGRAKTLLLSTDLEAAEDSGSGGGWTSADSGSRGRAARVGMPRRGGGGSATGGSGVGGGGDSMPKRRPTVILRGGRLTIADDVPVRRGGGPGRQAQQETGAVGSSTGTAPWERAIDGMIEAGLE